MLLLSKGWFDQAWRGKAVTLILAAVFVFGRSGAATGADPDMVIQWNIITQTVVTTAPSNPNLQTRWAAITQLAVYEAVNSITGDYEPYLGTIDAPEDASVDAAVIVAAYDTLVGLRPSATVGLDVVRDLNLAAIPDGDAKEDGIAVGQAAAAAMLALRANDGSDDVVPYQQDPAPGIWQPLSGQTPVVPQWGQVDPFALVDGSQFRLPPPPGLHTRKYADAYNEVKRLGRIDSAFRPQDRTDVARLYASASPVQVFDPAARQVSEAQGLTLSQNARLLARLNMAMADAAFACWDTKYHYNFWRPQAAIRGGDTDGNGLTQADPDWLPLISTPAHPSYASGHATVSGAAVAILRNEFGKDGFAVTISHPAVAGVVKDYTAWDQMTKDIDDARIYGGIHFRFDQDFGAKQGHAVGIFVLENYLRSEEEILDP